MKDSTILARRYSQALFAVAKPNKIVDEVLNDLDKITQALEISKKHNSLFFNSLVPYNLKIKLWKILLSNLKINKISESFIYLLLKRNRIQFFYKIKTFFLNLLHEDKGILRAQVISAIALNKSVKAELSTELSKIFNKEIELDIHLDKKILGGLIIKVGPYMIDSSIESKLRNLKIKISNTKIESLTDSSNQSLKNKEVKRVKDLNGKKSQSLKSESIAKNKIKKLKK